ncbi:MAG: hypothetical protein L6408_08045, partial [Nanoarchaeota archaeon]|nr:hypothetical protein [Nanoarchaeota archaeon]
MKKLVTLILIGIIAVTFGCVTTSSRGGNPCKNLSTRFDQARYEKLATVWQWDTFNQRGFVTIEEINEVMRLLDPPGFAAKIPYGKQNKTITWCYNHVSKLLRLVWLVDYDLLPYEAMMFLAIEKEDYQEAEHI